MAHVVWGTPVSVEDRTFEHSQFGEVHEVSFKLDHDAIQQNKSGSKFLDLFAVQASTEIAKVIRAAAKDGAAVCLLVRPNILPSKMGGWVKHQVLAVVPVS